MKINWFEQLLPLIGLVLFVAVLLRVDLKQLAVVLTNLNYFWIMGSLGLLVCSIVIRTIKWQILLEILEDRHGVSYTIVASQLSLEHWHEVIGNPTIADAILDRLIHNAYKINLKGESMRKKKNHVDSNTAKE